MYCPRFNLQKYILRYTRYNLQKYILRYRQNNLAANLAATAPWRPLLRWPEGCWMNCPVSATFICISFVFDNCICTWILLLYLISYLYLYLCLCLYFSGGCVGGRLYTNWRVACTTHSLLLHGSLRQWTCACVTTQPVLEIFYINHNSWTCLPQPCQSIV